MTIVPSTLGQALPAAEAAPISTGFSLPRAAGTLSYAVSAAESMTLGYYGQQGVYSSTMLSGDVAFLSNGKLYPFSIIFSGGHSFTTSGAPSYDFLNLAMSQVINVKRWEFVVSDSVAYLPGTPTGGLSGVAGVGDLGVNPVQIGVDAGQGLLTVYSDRVTNIVDGSVQRQFTGKTSLNASGSLSIMRFLGTGGNGLDGNTTTGGGGINHQVNAHTSFGGNYSYSTFAYPGNSAITVPGFTSQTFTGQFAHQLTRRLNMSISAGPQWSSIGSGGSQGLSAYVSAFAGYAGQSTHVSISYSHSTNSGFGVVGGALSQSENASIGRTFARVWNCSLNSSYLQSSSLPSASTKFGSFNTIVASAQVSRAIMRSLSAFASYTFEHQSSPSAATVDAFSGREQVIGFGLTYSPSSIHIGHQ